MRQKSARRAERRKRLPAAPSRQSHRKISLCRLRLQQPLELGGNSFGLLERREMARAFENREGRAGDAVMQRLRHGNWRCVVLLPYEHGGWHSERRKRDALVCGSEHPAGFGVSLHIIAQEHVDGLLDHVRTARPESITKPARALEADQRRKPLLHCLISALGPLLRGLRAIP